MKRRVHSPADVADLAGDELLTPHEVALLFGVGPKTLGRWARQGRIAAQWTLGGHRRFAAAEVARCLADTRPAWSGEKSDIQRVMNRTELR